VSRITERPWTRFYGDVPESLEYPRVTLYEALAASVERRPNEVAIDFLDAKLSYRELLDAVDRCAAALGALGLTAGDRITISTPTCPQGAIAFYAAAKLGVVASMIHPLSTASEIEGYLTRSGSRVALTLDALYAPFAEVRERTPLETLILARIPDYLGALKRLGFWLTRGRKIPRVLADPSVVWWSRLLDEDHPQPVTTPTSTDDPAAILYSGGTTGEPEGDRALPSELHQRRPASGGLGRPGGARHRPCSAAALPRLRARSARQRKPPQRREGRDGAGLQPEGRR